MIYRTQDFESPTGGIMIFAQYDTTAKELVFKVAEGYLYPQDSKNMAHAIQTDRFIQTYSASKETIEEATDYLQKNAIQHPLMIVT